MLALAGILLIPNALFAQEDEKKIVAEAPKPEEIDKRIAGVLPNYRTTDGTKPFERISAKEKLTIAAKDSFDKPMYVITAVLAGIGQATNSHPELGQGMAGYGRRYVRTLATNIIGNMMAEGVMPALLHDDPRYFRMGKSYGSVGKRIWYSATRVIVNRRDSGKWSFNTSEWLGNAVAVGIQNSYYTVGRTWSSNLINLGLQVGVDASSNVLKEFWPDLKRKFVHRH